MKNGLVIFDLDGTLINTSMDILDSLNFCLKSLSLKSVRYEDLTFLIGQGSRATLNKAFEMNAYDVSEEEMDRHVSTLLDHYQANIPGQSQPYPGVMNAILALENAGYDIGVCTNKLEHLAKKLLSELGIIDHFSVITGGDTFSYRKPDARHILSTIELAGADPQQAVMIGDSINDILAAQNANIASIAVPFGFSDVPVADLNPTHIINHFDELTPDLVGQLILKSN